MVDECEDGQSAALDSRHQRGHRRSESGYASVSDHFVSSDELSEEDVLDREVLEQNAPRESKCAVAQRNQTPRDSAPECTSPDGGGLVQL
jgi:hypothetical protein